MKTMIKYLITAALLSAPVFSQNLILLTPDGSLLNSADAKAWTVTDSRNLQEFMKQSFISAGKQVTTDTAVCGESLCARGVLAEKKSEGVVYSRLQQLGSKIFLTATLVEANTEFSRKITAVSLEDLEPGLNGLAKALIQKKELVEVQDLENITQAEIEKSQTRRESFYKNGISIGYLFPVAGSYPYYKGETYKKYDPALYETKYSQLIRFGLQGWWEFDNNTAINVEGAWAFPQAIGANLNLLKISNRNNTSPFFGGGIGLNYILDNRGSFDEFNDRRRSGITLNAQGGLLLFRTYSMSVMARTRYEVVLNDNIDHAIIVDVAVLYK